MTEELERILRVAFYWGFRTFGWWGILYAGLACLAAFLFFALIRLLVTALEAIHPKVESRIEAKLESAVRFWHRQGRSWVRKYFPIFLATYIIMAGLAVVLGRFSIESALIGCPAVAAGASYCFNRVKRTE